MSIRVSGFRSGVAVRAVASPRAGIAERKGVSHSRRSALGQGIRNAFRQSAAALPKAATGLFLALSACAPQAGPGQVVTRVTAPPWKTSALEQHDNAACNRDANGIVRVFVQCMERRGYRVDLIGPGGVPMSATQIPDAPSTNIPRGYGVGVQELAKQRLFQSSQSNGSLMSTETLSVKPEELQNYITMSVAAIEQDSKSWITEKYDRTKLTNFRTPSGLELGAIRNHNPDSMWIHINYYSDDVRKYITVDFNRQQVQCISYSWDPFNGYFNGAGSRCHTVMTEEDARQAAVFRQKWEAGMQQIRQQVIEHMLGARPSNAPASNGNIGLPGPSISNCNKLTTGSFVSGAMGNFWCD